MWSGSFDIELNKDDTGYSAFCRDRRDIVGRGQIVKEAIGDLVLKYAEQTGKITSPEAIKEQENSHA